MTEIKIPFHKLKVEKYSNPDKPTNAEGLELKTSPIFFDKFYEETPSYSPLNKIELAFFDGAEAKIYKDLLDDDKDEFELSFEKEKVNFYIVGSGEPDDDKIGISYSAKDSNSSLKIFFKPQFARTVKIIPASQDKDEKLERELSDLKFQVKFLEDKIRDNNSDPDTIHQYQQKLQELKIELQEKERINNNNNNNNNNNKSNLPLIISGGVIVFLLIIVFYLLGSRRRN